MHDKEMGIGVLNSARWLRRFSYTPASILPSSSTPCSSSSVPSSPYSSVKARNTLYDIMLVFLTRFNALFSVITSLEKMRHQPRGRCLMSGIPETVRKVPTTLPFTEELAIY